MLFTSDTFRDACLEYTKLVCEKRTKMKEVPNRKEIIKISEWQKSILPDKHDRRKGNEQQQKITLKMRTNIPQSVCVSYGKEN